MGYLSKWCHMSTPCKENTIFARRVEGWTNMFLLGINKVKCRVEGGRDAGR